MSVSVQVQSPASAGEPELGVDERHGDLLLTGSHILAPWSLLCTVRLLPDYCLSPRPLPELLATYQRGAGPWLAQAVCAHTFMCHQQQLTLNINFVSSYN